MCQGHWAHTLA